MYFYRYLHPRSLALFFDPKLEFSPVAVGDLPLFNKKFFIPFSENVLQKTDAILKKLEFKASFFIFRSSEMQSEALDNMALSFPSSEKANFLLLRGYLHEAVKLIQDSDGILCLETEPANIIHAWLVANLMNRPFYLLEKPDIESLKEPQKEIGIPFVWHPFGEMVVNKYSTGRVDVLHLWRVYKSLNLACLNQTRVISILFWGRSGSVFMQSLLDSHPQLLSTPATALHRYYQNWSLVLNEINNYVQNGDIKTQNHFLDVLLDLFKTAYPSLFYASPDITGCNLDKLGEEKKDILAVDFFRMKDLFYFLYKQIFVDKLVLSRKDLFLILHYCYEAVLGRDLNPKKKIIFQLHAPDIPNLLSDVLDDFPNMKFIGMMREPIRGLHSHLRMHVIDQRNGRYGCQPKPNYDYPELVYDGSYTRFIRHQLTGWRYLKTTYPANPIYEIALEKLHAEPEKEMRNLANWLEIDWHPGLLESTFNGLKYWGDIHANQEIQGFSKQHPLSDHWQDHFTPFDKNLLNFLLKTDLERMGYQNTSLFITVLGLLALMIPTKLEALAFQHAYKNGMEKELQDTIVAYVDRLSLYVKAMFNKSVI